MFISNYAFILLLYDYDPKPECGKVLFKINERFRVLNRVMFEQINILPFFKNKKKDNLFKNIKIKIIYIWFWVKNKK